MWKERYEENNGSKYEERTKRKNQKEHYNDQRLFIVTFFTLRCCTDPFVQVCLKAPLHIVPNTIKN
jgi:hypothetical protein